MTLTRTLMFWIAMLAAVIAAVVLLREILLPFVAGMVLAYLLDPLARRLERLGVKRVVAALIIVGVFVLGFLVLAILIAPILGGQLLAFAEKMPGYVTKLQALLADPSLPWLKKVIGDTFTDPEQST